MAEASRKNAAVDSRDAPKSALVSVTAEPPIAATVAAAVDQVSAYP